MGAAGIMLKVASDCHYWDNVQCRNTTNNPYASHANQLLPQIKLREIEGVSKYLA